MPWNMSKTLFLRGNYGFQSYFVSKLKQGVKERLGSRGTASNIDIYRQNVIYSLKHRIAAVHAASGSTCSHGDDPFGLRHLVVNALHSEGHFVGDCTGNDHHVGLARGEAHDLGAKP